MATLSFSFSTSLSSLSAKPIASSHPTLVDLNPAASAATTATGWHRLPQHMDDTSCRPPRPASSRLRSVLLEMQKQAALRSPQEYTAHPAAPTHLVQSVLGKCYTI
mmetsp:Transcript_36554/g.100871  ORF Transcript_36554/g.100871 Transcript_36554/m.100871 type:complete len:106 (-) Transcript_36554:3479-3796(-)